MGQAAGLKRRKRRVGNYNVLKNRKSQHRKEQHLRKAGLEFLGLEGADNGQCLLTRIEHGGLVADLKKFNKIDPKMFIHQAENQQKEKVAKMNRRTTVNLCENLETKRKVQKKALYAKRDVALPGPTVKLLSYYLDKYGEDYKAMSRDVRNYDQATEKQLYRSVVSFKSSKQFIDYLKDRGLVSTPHPATQDKSLEDSTSEESEQEMNEAEEESDEEEREDPVQQQQEKLRSKLSVMEKASKQLKKQITSRCRKAKVMTEDFEVMEEGEVSSDDEQVANKGRDVVAVSKQHKKNILKRQRMKKFKNAKKKRLEKEKHKHRLEV